MSGSSNTSYTTSGSGVVIGHHSGGESLKGATINTGQSPAEQRDAAGNNSDEKFYEMSKAKKGRMLIISNEDFTNPAILGPLPGYAIDRGSLQQLGKILGYDVEEPKVNLTAQQIRKELEDFGKTLANYDSAMIFTLSHGNETSIYGTDGELVGRHEFYEALCPALDKCPHMKGKPRLFFFQACRGDKKDKIVASDFYSKEQIDQVLKPKEIHQTAAPGETEKYVLAWTDMLTADATAYGYVSWVDNNSGSDFITALTSIFRLEWKKHNIEYMLKLVHDRILPDIQGTASADIQATTYRSYLRKTFHFNK